MLSTNQYEDLEPAEQANADDVIDGLIEQGQAWLDEVGPGYDPTDPKHPDFHDTFADLADLEF
jgi:hypothetical protein